MAKFIQTKDENGNYPGCYNCKYYFDLYSDIFGSCPVCEHVPNPEAELLFYIRDYDAPCPYFDYNVVIPMYKHVCHRDVYRKRQ